MAAFTLRTLSYVAVLTLYRRNRVVLDFFGIFAARHRTEPHGSAVLQL